MMGLAAKLLSCMRGTTPEHQKLVQDVAAEMEVSQEQWIAGLRKQGVKAAHPDDGWVDRENNTVTFCYPHFNDGVQTGDVIALGWPAWGGKSCTRLVRVLGPVPAGLFGGSEQWAFEILPCESSR